MFPNREELWDKRVQGIIDETCEWALTGITKGISDVHLTFESVPPWNIHGSVVMNNNNGVISMKGWVYGKIDVMDDEYCFIDLNLVWHSLTHREWKQWQEVCNLTQKEVLKLDRHRRQAKEGILPLEYYQSMNRKVIITKYYEDGGAIYE